MPKQTRKTPKAVNPHTLGNKIVGEIQKRTGMDRDAIINAAIREHLKPMRDRNATVDAVFNRRQQFFNDPKFSWVLLLDVDGRNEYVQKSTGLAYIGNDLYSATCVVFGQEGTDPVAEEHVEKISLAEGVKIWRELYTAFVVTCCDSENGDGYDKFQSDIHAALSRQN